MLPWFNFKAFAWFFYTNRSLGFWSSQILTFYTYSAIKCSNSLNFRTFDLAKEVKK
jgi:hypothetical protein